MSDLGLGLLSNGSGRTSVNRQRRGQRHGLDQTLLLQVQKSAASNRAVNLQAVNKDGRGDELVGRDLLDHLVISSLVHVDGVVGLFLGLSLGPLLLLLCSRSLQMIRKMLINREKEGKAMDG